MKRKTLFIVNTVIVLLAAVLWLLPRTERIVDTHRTAVAFLADEAVGTTNIAVDITQENYLFRGSEVSGTVTVDTDSAEPLVYDVTQYGSLDTVKSGVIQTWTGNLVSGYIFATGDDMMIVIPSNDVDPYSYVAFNGTYEDAAEEFSELLSVIGAKLLGFTENPFK